MRKVPNPKFFMILTAITVVVGLGLTFIQYSSLLDTQAKVAQLRKDQLDQGKLEDKLKTSLSQLQECSNSLSHLEKGVPELDYVPTMLKQLEDAGTQSGLVVLGVRPVPKQDAAKDSSSASKDKKTPKKQYTELDIEVTCRGDYKSVRNFVHALSVFPKIVAAKTISITPKQQDSKSQDSAPKLDVTISLRSYLFPPDKSDMTKAVPVASNQEAVTHAS